MTFTIVLPLLVCILGVLVYALASNSKTQELGRLAYGAGLLVTLWEFAAKIISL